MSLCRLLHGVYSPASSAVEYEVILASSPLNPASLLHPPSQIYLTILYALHPQPTMTPPTTPDPTTLLTLEHQAWSVLTHSGRALLPLLADDSVMVFPGGMKLSAESDNATRGQGQGTCHAGLVHCGFSGSYKPQANSKTSQQSRLHLSIQPDQSQIPSCRSQSLPRAEYAFSCPKIRSAKRLFPSFAYIIKHAGGEKKRS